MNLTSTAFLAILFVPRRINCHRMSGLNRERWCERTKESFTRVVELVIEEIAQRHECMVFITDEYYKRLIDLAWIEKSEIKPVYTICSQPHLFRKSWLSETITNSLPQSIRNPLHWRVLNTENSRKSFYIETFLIQISIRDNEDFAPPKEHLQAVLAESRVNSCSGYVILITNGLQICRLLRYAESERLLDTRGTFLLPHDRRLFHPDMNYIWNRMVNAVFVRRYDSLKRRSGERVFDETIDLEFIRFPVNVERSLATSNVDTWSRGKFRRGGDHFAEKTRDFGKKTLRVAILEHIPAVTKSATTYYERTNKNIFSQTRDTAALGVEFELIRVIAEAMNFKPYIYTPPNVETEKWGVAGENQSYTGLIGEAVAARAPFLLGDLHYTSYYLRYLDLSWPYNTECLTFLTPESLTDNSWKLLALPFKFYIWIAIFLTLVAGGTMFYLLSMCYKRQISLYKENDSSVIETVKFLPENDASTEGESQLEETFEMKGLDIFTKPLNSILYAYSMLLLVSLSRLPNAWAVRVFIGWWWLYSILVAVAYRASMTAILANPISRTTIDTLEQLANSTIAVGGWGRERKDFLLASADDESRKIGERFELTADDDDAVARVANGTFAFYENAHFLRQMRAQRRILEEEMRRNASRQNEELVADRNLHIMQECIVNMPISIGLDKNSPLKPRVDELVKRAVEAGLTQKWLSDVLQWTLRAEKTQETGSQKSLIDIRKLSGALVALAIGYFFGCLALMSELLHWKYIVLRNPTFDKYYLDVFYKQKR